MNPNIPDYEKISLINEHQESLERLEEQTTQAKAALKAKKKRIQDKLGQDRNRLASQVRKEKDATVTKRELDRFREQEAAEYLETAKSLNKEVGKFLESQEYLEYIVDFYRRHRAQITGVIAPKDVARMLEAEAAASEGDRIVLQTETVDYDFSPAVVRPQVVKKLLVQG